MNKKSMRERAALWAEWFSMFWKLLDEDQRESYIAQFLDTETDPPAFTTDDMSDIEIRKLQSHQGDTIKKYREAASKSLEDVAIALGRTKGYLSLVENGTRSLPVVDTYKLMKLLHIPVEEMFTIK